MNGRDFNFRLSHPSCIYICGPSKSGKSTLTREILLRHDEVFDSPIHEIIYCYGTPQDKWFAKLGKECPKITFHAGLPDEFGDESCTAKLYVLDDLLQECSKSPNVLNAFIREAHHKNISVILISQVFFYPGLRSLTLNCHYICLFKNPREMQVVRTLGMQMMGKKNTCLEEGFRDACSKPHGYLFIDLSQEQDDDCRIRDNLFGDNGCKVYMMKK